MEEINSYTFKLREEGVEIRWKQRLASRHNVAVVMQTKSQRHSVLPVYYRHAWLRFSRNRWDYLCHYNPLLPYLRSALLRNLFWGKRSAVPKSGTISNSPNIAAFPDAPTSEFHGNGSLAFFLARRRALLVFISGKHTSLFLVIDPDEKAHATPKCMKYV